VVFIVLFVKVFAVNSCICVPTRKMVPPTVFQNISAQKCFSLNFMCRFFTDSCQDKIVLIRRGSVLSVFHMKPRINFIDFFKVANAQKTLNFVVTVRIINRYNFYFSTP